VRIALPKFLCESNIHTLTIPVPKVHCMTGISLSLKNQWGCLPDMMRLRQRLFRRGHLPDQQGAQRKIHRGGRHVRSGRQRSDH
jgi:uncharacterized protein (DUF362 family)